MLYIGRILYSQHTTFLFSYASYIFCKKIPGNNDIIEILDRQGGSYHRYIPRTTNGSNPAACVPATANGRRFHVMNDLYHRNEAIRRYHVPGHTAYRALRCFARQHKAGSKKRPQEDAKPPPAEKNRSHGSPNARPRAGLVPRYKTGSLFGALARQNPQLNWG